MRIGVNALYLLPGCVGGTEVYLRSLLAALASIDSENHYFVYVNAETDDDLVPAAGNYHLVRCRVRASFRPLRIAYEQLALPLHLLADQIDVVFNPGFTAPVLTCCPSVTVFHDLQHKCHPEFFRWYDLPFWNLFLWLAARRSRTLIAVSAATAHDVACYYPFAERKTVVVHHGVDPRFFEIGLRRARRERSDHILAVSTLHPHKNLERLLQAFGLFRRSRPDQRLVIVGIKGLASGRLEARVRELQLEDCVSFEGWISRINLYDLFETAGAFISPSLFEGFGMSVVEALAAGIPVAISAIPAMEEVAEKVALRFDPHSVDAIASVLARLVDDNSFRTMALRLGPERARAFDWGKAAARTLRELTDASVR